jgi:DNA-binding CsgD family transcriptional regulator
MAEAGGNEVLLERRPQLEALREWLAEARAGQGRLVFLGGEAGVGKTALARSFLASLDDLTTAVGACDPFDTPRPLGPVVDLAGRLGGDLDRLLAGGGRRDQVFAAVLAGLRAAAPAALVLEDVHWADEATFDLIRFLGRRIADLPLLLLTTYRSDETYARHPLVATMGDLASLAAVRRLGLSPLSRGAVTILAAGRHPDPERLHAITGGNPFFVTEVLASRTDGVPATVRDAVMARTTRLSTAGRQVLEAAAAIGRRAVPALVDMVARAGVEAIDECVASGVLEQQDGGIAFRHELARSAVLESIPAGRCSTLYARVLSALRTGPFAVEDPATLAHYAVLAGDAAAVLELAPRAAEQAGSLGVPRQAAAQLDAALRLGAVLTPARRAALLELRSRHCYVAGDWPEALISSSKALHLRREMGDRAGEAENLAVMTQLHYLAGDPAVAAPLASLAMERLPELAESPPLARTLASLTLVHAARGRIAEAIELGRQAIEVAERVGETEALAVAATMTGMVLVDSVHGPGQALLVRGLELALESGRDDMVVGSCTSLYGSDVVRRHFDDAQRWYDRGMEYLASRELRFGQAWIDGARCLERMYRGQWTEAADLARMCCAAPIPLFRAVPLVVLGTVAARRGRSDAFEHLDAALAAADAGRSVLRLMAARAARAEAAWLRGSTAQALAEADAGLALDSAYANPWMRGELIAWRRRAGGDVAAEGPIAEPYALQLAGHGRRAAEWWRSMDCPYEAAWALADGDDEPGLREAHHAFERLGAEAACRRIVQRLRVAGAPAIPRGRRATTRAQPFGLTSRERDVVDLVIQGWSDSAIAAHLCVSRRTASHHVSAILAKLEVSSRREVAERYREGRR